MPWPRRWPAPGRSAGAVHARRRLRSRPGRRPRRRGRAHRGFALPLDLLHGRSPPDHGPGWPREQRRPRGRPRPPAGLAPPGRDRRRDRRRRGRHARRHLGRDHERPVPPGLRREPPWPPRRRRGRGPDLRPAARRPPGHAPAWRPAPTCPTRPSPSAARRVVPGRPPARPSKSTAPPPVTSYEIELVAAAYRLLVWPSSARHPGHRLTSGRSGERQWCGRPSRPPG